jgi:hypothetical protein
MWIPFPSPARPCQDAGEEQNAGQPPAAPAIRPLSSPAAGVASPAPDPFAIHPGRSMRPIRVLAVLALGACAPPATLPLPAAPPTLRVAEADSVRDVTVAPGVLHRSLWDARGPWAVHVLEVSPAACGVEVRTVKAGGQLQGRARTSELAREAERLWARPALGAVNADFFSFTPPGVPVGAQVSAGEVIRGPVSRPVFGVAADGAFFIAVVGLEGELRARDGFAAPLAAVNTRPAGERIAMFTRFAGERTPPDTAALAVRVRLLEPAAPGDTARAAVLDTLAAIDGVTVPEGGAVLTGRGRGAAFLRGVVAPGDTVRWWLGFEGAPGPVREMVGGWPRLLQAGEHVHDQDAAVTPAFGETRHPRTAVGWRPDGTLLLVAVDGRQPHSDGMSLGELAALFLRLGATEALNLDGGGSTTMVVRGEVVNRPSDREGERANANALVVLGPVPGQCPAPATAR